MFIKEKPTLKIIITAGLIFILLVAVIIYFTKDRFLSLTKISISQNFNLQTAYVAQDKAMGEFFDLYADAGGLGTAKAKNLKEKFQAAQKEIVGQLSLLPTYQGALKTEYQQFLEANLALLMAIKPYLDFFDQVGPIYEQIYVMENKLKVNSLAELSPLKTYLQERLTSVVSQQGAVFQMKSTGNLEKAKEAYYQALILAAEYLVGANAAIANNDWGRYQQARADFEKNYYQKAEAMIAFLNPNNDPLINAKIITMEQLGIPLHEKITGKKISTTETPANDVAPSETRYYRIAFDYVEGKGGTGANEVNPPEAVKLPEAIGCNVDTPNDLFYFYLPTENKYVLPVENIPGAERRKVVRVECDYASYPYNLRVFIDPTNDTIVDWRLGQE